MAADLATVRYPFTDDGDDILQVAIKISYSTLHYRSIPLKEVIEDLFIRSESNVTASIFDILDTEVDETAARIPALEHVGGEPAYLVAKLIKNVLGELPNNDRNLQLLIPVGIFCFLATLSFLVMLFSGFRISKRTCLETFLIAPAWASVTVLSVLVCIYGEAGKHIWDISFNSWQLSLRWAIIFQYFITVAHFFIDMSLLTFYYRLSSKRSFRMAVVVAAIIITGHAIAQLVADFLGCRPFVWVDQLFSARCTVDRFALSLSGVTIFTALDLLLLLLPFQIVWQLKLDKKQKIMLSSLFVFGTFVCVASAMRIVVVHTLRHEVDTTFHIESLLWPVFELNTAVICACALIGHSRFFRERNINEISRRHSQKLGDGSQDIEAQNGDMHEDPNLRTEWRSSAGSSGKAESSMTLQPLRMGGLGHSSHTSIPMYNLEDSGRISASNEAEDLEMPQMIGTAMSRAQSDWDLEGDNLRFSIIERKNGADENVISRGSAVSYFE